MLVIQKRKDYCTALDKELFKKQLKARDGFYCCKIKLTCVQNFNINEKSNNYPQKMGGGENRGSSECKNKVYSLLPILQEDLANTIMEE